MTDKPRCTAVKKDGERCKIQPYSPDPERCLWHSERPEIQAEAKKRRSRGGHRSWQARSNPKPPKLDLEAFGDLSTLDGCLEAQQQIMNELRTGVIPNASAKLLLDGIGCRIKTFTAKKPKPTSKAEPESEDMPENPISPADQLLSALRGEPEATPIMMEIASRIHAIHENEGRTLDLSSPQLQYIEYSSVMSILVTDVISVSVSQYAPLPEVFSFAQLGALELISHYQRQRHINPRSILTP